MRKGKIIIGGIVLIVIILIYLLFSNTTKKEDEISRCYDNNDYGYSSSYNIIGSKITVSFMGYSGEKTILGTGDTFLSIYDNKGIESDMYAIYKDTIFYYGIAMSGVDVKSFKHIGGEYWIDNNGVYAFGKRLNMNPLKFQVFYKNDDRYGKDEKRVIITYLASCDSIKSSLTYIKKEDTTIEKTFDDLFCGVISYLDLDPRKVSVAGNREVGTYTSDGNKLYTDGSYVSGINLDKLAYVGGFGYIKDDKNIYFLNKILAGGDSNSFQAITVGYAKDSKHIYSREYLISNDTKNFSYLGSLYAKDLNTVFFNGLSITGADIESFKVLGGDNSYYNAIDKKYIYHKGKPILGINPDKITWISGGFWCFKDDKGIYFVNGKEILNNGRNLFHG